MYSSLMEGFMQSGPCYVEEKYNSKYLVGWHFVMLAYADLRHESCSKT